MHVMYIIDSMHGGGAETSVLELAPGLAHRGVRTSIVTLLSDDGCLEDRIDALGLRRIRLKFRDPFTISQQLRALIGAERPDVIHTTLLFANLTGRIAARMTGIPVVTTLANDDYGPEHRSNSPYGVLGVRGAYAADRITAPLTTRFHAISHYIAKTMRCRLRIPGDRIQVVYRGRDPARLGRSTLDRRMRVRAALSIDAKAPVVLALGGLTRRRA